MRMSFVEKKSLGFLFGKQNAKIIQYPLLFRQYMDEPILLGVLCFEHKQTMLECDFFFTNEKGDSFFNFMFRKG